MKRNVGGMDKALRIIAGIILISLAFILKNGDSLWAWGFLGVIPLATGLFGKCFLYDILGVNTSQK